MRSDHPQSVQQSAWKTWWCAGFLWVVFHRGVSGFTTTAAVVPFWSSSSSDHHRPAPFRSTASRHRHGHAVVANYPSMDTKNDTAITTNIPTATPSKPLASRQEQRQRARSLEGKIQAKFAIDSNSNNKESSLSSSSSPANILLVVDANNVRGKHDFRWTSRDFIRRLDEWYDRQVGQMLATKTTSNEGNNSIHSPSLSLVVVWDHARETTAVPHEFGSNNNKNNNPPTKKNNKNGLMLFAGPHCTADDVIVHATQFWTQQQQQDQSKQQQQQQQQPHVVWIVTSDGDLKRRCLRVAQGPAVFLRRKASRKRHTTKRVLQRLPPQDAAQVFGSAQLVKCLDDDESNSVGPSNGEEDGKNDCLVLLERLEQDLRRYQASHPPWKSRSEREAAEQQGPWLSRMFVGTTTKTTNDKFPAGDDEQHPTTATAPTVFDEKTWHRVLISETLRQSLLYSSPESSSSSSSQGDSQPLPTMLQQYQQHMINEPPTRRVSAVSDAPGAAATETTMIPLELESMFLDHRIRHEKLAQRRMLEYLNLSMEGASSSGDLLSVSEPTAMESESTTSTTPLELAARALQQIVLESAEKSQDLILNRYCREAPAELQFSRLASLRELLEHVAIKQKRAGDARRKWYLRGTVDNDGNVKLPPLDALYNVQPGRGRRSQQRQRQRRASREVDTQVVAAGKSAEERWWTLFQGLVH